MSFTEKGVDVLGLGNIAYGVIEGNTKSTTLLWLLLVFTGTEVCILNVNSCSKLLAWPPSGDADGRRGRWDPHMGQVCTHSVICIRPDAAHAFNPWSNTEVDLCHISPVGAISICNYLLQSMKPEKTRAYMRYSI